MRVLPTLYTSQVCRLRNGPSAVVPHRWLVTFGSQMLTDVRVGLYFWCAPIELQPSPIADYMDRPFVESFGELRKQLQGQKPMPSFNMPMLPRIAHSTLFGLVPAIKRPLAIAKQIRGFATVEGNTPRVQPTPSRTRSTPISYDRATFTIRVREYKRRCWGHNVDLSSRMVRFSTASPSAPNPTSLVRLFSPRRSSDIPSP